MTTTGKNGSRKIEENASKPITHVSPRVASRGSVVVSVYILYILHRFATSRPPKCQKKVVCGQFFPPRRYLPTNQTEFRPRFSSKRINYGKYRIRKFIIRNAVFVRVARRLRVFRETQNRVGAVANSTRNEVSQFFYCNGVYRARVCVCVYCLSNSSIWCAAMLTSPASRLVCLRFSAFLRELF